ncbi:MAG: hypothetical protein COT25_03600 [Candidatus Kerfeldbacteria bacterium CG08_land_8_20_14_0_20_42_7]|uniref:DUF2268 domain-containing protein n=1 Tax=Candidatus Kerfeldbacteria bacterium CG08_land_8_20_14_0_20_42_7 TaxID=2014245 RepID=A0A2H0YUD2_9BACT|nr:MAG: hypothetical protein COT25_03600 [Candidatus Kerfeldbacteria bacterium CG08_land_8_20_14_0_20_42_7]
MLKITRKSFTITSFLFDKITSSKDIFELTKKIKTTQNGYAGFNTKKELRAYLDVTVGEPKKITSKLTEKQILQAVTKSVTICKKYSPINNGEIFLFPTYDPFVQKKMFGVSGFTPWKSTILLFIHPACKSLQQIQYTLAHEYAHATMLRYHKWETLEDSLLFEGIAEHFREKTVGGKKAPWVKAISQKKSEQLLKRIKPKLKSKDPAWYGKIFLGQSKSYPLWSGYAIGYYIIEKMLKNGVNLLELIKKPRIHE